MTDMDLLRENGKLRKALKEIRASVYNSMGPPMVDSSYALAVINKIVSEALDKEGKE